ncbi:glycoside hydrolase family 3 domain protein [Spirochaeta thermophila DSM 6578]|uniref:beta-glucosidase n=1 Tax=Winmispira thermophila (strain ATCC 700085 / DSM 6578 / Z-1203) TaxID=869211 RepID=G0GCI8_WINT7|nr:glycoside hydrolase family 3 N-terminal domain-containing protein [Spirochaeta thermophila]AEJ62054.1 glycoside hydrolase family 3 domain protein [Spirochaeta thermophila DSM 6578]
MKNHKPVWLLMIVFLLFPTWGCGVKGDPSRGRFRDSSLSPEERARDLLSYMTIEEKIGQMAMVDRGYLKSPHDIAEYGLGAILSGGGSAPRRNTPESWKEMVDGFQREALGTRLGIPILYGIDAVHGHNNVHGAVIFPHNIGLGATGDPELVERIGRAVAEEVVATGIHWTFAPCVTVPQDERWGRTYEGFGEDPELVARLGAALIRGFQGVPAPESLARPDTILATAKHFVADGGTTGGKDRGDARLTEEELRKVHLRPYVEAVKAGVGSVMVSFSSINGVKMHANRDLIQGVLRGELGFDGLIVSDWAAHTELPGSLEEKLATVINAGVDMIMIPDDYRGFVAAVKSLVEEGVVSRKRIDEAVYRILLTKFRLGLFERPIQEDVDFSMVGSEPHRALAREAVRKSVVLLKNDGGVLPLKKEGTRILVLGDKADDLGVQCGGWTITWQGKRGRVTEGTTILEAIRKAVSDPSLVTHVRRASQLAQVKADVIIVVVGETPYAEMYGDRQDLSLTREDAELIIHASQTGLPVVVVLVSGRPRIITDLLDSMDALLAVWLPGTEGDGIADVLFGDYAPTGKLPFVWPRSMEVLPLTIEESGHHPEKALFPYGYGLSY